eukprot:jgi/Undpi1/7781/HiC_scaffold_23.g10254.m1
MSGIINIDASKAVVPDEFNTIEKAVVVDDGQGTGRWVLQKLGISLDGSIRAASSLSASNLQTTLGMLVTVGDADNPPDFFQITAAAFGGGGSPGEIEEHAKRDMCAQVAEYLWRCSGRGKMKVAEGYLIFPSISFSASGVAAAAEGHRERDDDVQSVASASPAGSAVLKRTQKDLQSLISELDGMAERTGGESSSSNLGVSAGSVAKKAKPTYVTHKDKWNAKYANLLRAMSSLDRLKCLREPQQYGHMTYIKHLISELERLTRLDDSLRDARAFILTLVAGVDFSLEHGQPLVAALWLQDKLKSESEEGDMVGRSAIVEELTTVGKFLSSDKFSGSKSSLWSGYPVQQPLLSPHFGDLGGTAALGSMTAFGGTSTLDSFGGLGGPPAWSNGSQFQGARNKSRGGKVGKVDRSPAKQSPRAAKSARTYTKCTGDIKVGDLLKKAGYHLLDIHPAFHSHGAKRAFDIEIKRHVVELYAATPRVVTINLRKEISAALLPIVYINTDLWTSKVSGDKYIGLSIFYMDAKGIVQTMLLAVKHFRPAPSLGKVTGQVVMLWVRQVLAQNGLHEKDIAGAVTDAGSDVRTGVGEAFDREWCIPHMSNRATIDGTGMSQTKETPKNLLCRCLLELCKKVVEMANRSASFKIRLEDAVEEATGGKGSKAKLTQAVAQRWVTICFMLLRVLQRWDALGVVYMNCSTVLPLTGKRNELEEEYSIVTVVNDNIFYCQKTLEPTGQGALRRLFFLLTDTLEPNKPLKIVHVAPVGAESGTSISRRPHQQLTETGRETRDAFRVAFATRFLPRYGKNLVNRSHVFDRTMFLCRGARRLKYVDSLLASTAAVGVALASASEIKTKIRAEVHSLLTDAVKEKRVRDKKAAEAATAIVDTPAAKRARTTAGGGSATQGGGSATEGGGSATGGGGSVSSHHTTETLHGAGFWDDSDDDQEPLPPVDRDAKEGLNSLLNGWMEMKLEMCLYLRAQYDSIPPDIPQLADDAVQNALSERFKDPALLHEVQVMDYAEEQHSDEDDDTVDPAWVAADPQSRGSGHEGGDSLGDKPCEAAAEGRQVGEDINTKCTGDIKVGDLLKKAGDHLLDIHPAFHSHGAPRAFDIEKPCEAAAEGRQVGEDINTKCTGDIKVGDLLKKAGDHLLDIHPAFHSHGATRAFDIEIHKTIDKKQECKVLGTSAEEEESKQACMLLRKQC